MRFDLILTAEDVHDVKQLEALWTHRTLDQLGSWFALPDEPQPVLTINAEGPGSLCKMLTFAYIAHRLSHADGRILSYVIQHGLTPEKRDDNR